MCTEALFFIFSFFGFYKLKQIQLQGKEYIGLGGPCDSRRLQVIMSVRGLTFHVTTKLLQVTIRLLVYQIESFGDEMMRSCLWGY
jgi:hypothetical protein